MTRHYKNKPRRHNQNERWDKSWDDYDEGYDYAEPHRLRRNKIDGIIGGVCAGIGDYFDLDPLLIRIIFVLSVLFLGFPLLAYVLLWIFIPSDKRAPYRREYRVMRDSRRRAKRRRKAHDYEEEQVTPRRSATFRDVKSKFRSLETRLQDLESSITSKEWKLRRDFRDLEN